MNDTEKDNYKNLVRRDIGFVAKVLVITICVTAAIAFLLPSSESLKSLENPKTVTLVLSLFDNPEALIMVSEHYEKKNKFEYALISTRLAVGALEMRNGNSKALMNYRERVLFLQGKVTEGEN